jgi:hypothetical protein
MQQRWEFRFDSIGKFASVDRSIIRSPLPHLVFCARIIEYILLDLFLCPAIANVNQVKNIRKLSGLFWMGSIA